MAIGLIAAYLALLVWRYDSLPPTLSNDAIAEVESGFRLFDQARFAVMTFEPSRNGVETLWVSLAGLLIELMGHNTLPAVMSSWIAAMLVLLSLAFLARADRARIDPVIVVLCVISMPWFFHFSRSAMRCLSAASFLSITLGALYLFLSDGPRRWRGPMILGMSLALAIYAYTASRVPPIAFLVFLVGHLGLVFRRDRSLFKAWSIQYGKTALIAMLISVPNIIYALNKPDQFFDRGVSYNLRATPDQWIRHIFDAMALPVQYDHARFAETGADTYLFDTSSIILPSARISPVPIVIGISFVAGWIVIARSWRGPILGVAVFAGVCYLLVNILIGFTGPSQSRLSINIPIVALGAGAALTALANRVRKLNWICSGLAIQAAFSVWVYQERVCNPQLSHLFAQTTRRLADEATRRSRDGQRLLIILKRDRGYFAYYTAERKTVMHVSEFFMQRYEGSRISEEKWESSDAVLIERDAALEGAIVEARSRSQLREVEDAPAGMWVFERVHQPVGGNGID